MRRLAAILLTICLCGSLVGCFAIVQERPYRFRQSVDQISTIEIAEVLSNEDYSSRPETKTITVINENQYSEIIESISNAKGNYVLEGAVYALGKYVLCITYKNGAVEIIGEWSYRLITPEGQVNCGCYWFDSEQFHSIISGYIPDGFKTGDGLCEP